jgi:hypothetical protein
LKPLGDRKLDHFLKNLADRFQFLLHPQSPLFRKARMPFNQ